MLGSVCRVPMNPIEAFLFNSHNSPLLDHCKTSALEGVRNELNFVDLNDCVGPFWFNIYPGEVPSGTWELYNKNHSLARDLYLVILMIHWGVTLENEGKVFKKVYLIKCLHGAMY